MRIRTRALPWNDEQPARTLIAVDLGESSLIVRSEHVDHVWQTVRQVNVQHTVAVVHPNAVRIARGVITVTGRNEHPTEGAADRVELIRSETVAGHPYAC